jgi:hypothetical protein
MPGSEWGRWGGQGGDAPVSGAWVGVPIVRALLLQMAVRIKHCLASGLDNDWVNADADVAPARFVRLFLSICPTHNHTDPKATTPSSQNVAET